MASKFPDEPPCDTQGTDEGSIAFRKKRSRRVSFADREITSIHIFKRDDDYETPPDSTPKQASELEKEVTDLFRDLVDSDDSTSGGDDEDDNDDVMSARKSFLRPIDTPSPGGSSTVGSATSNDEDNFFGPVSANFIRPGRLSDSAASDDNHDITMDSTAFSMHFRSIARSESGDFNTSMGVPLPSEEKTPFQARTSSDLESFMVLTEVGKLKSPLAVPINRDSNDMSLVGESMHRYDYGRLSPALEALLAEGSEFNAIPASDSAKPKLLTSAVSHGNGNDCTEPLHFRDSELCTRNNNDISGNGTSIAHNSLVEATSDTTTTLAAKILRDCSSNSKDSPVADDFVDHQTPKQLNKVRSSINLMLPRLLLSVFWILGDNENSEVQSVTRVLNLESIAITNGTPVNQSGEAFQLELVRHFENGNQLPTIDGLKENFPQLHGSPLAGSIHSLSAKRQQILLDTTNSPRRMLFVTPSPKQSGSVLSKGSINEGGTVASFLKSNSELKIPEPSSCASAFSDGGPKSKLGLSESLSSRALSFNTIMEEMNEDLQCQQENAFTNNREEKLSGVGLKQRERDCSGLGTPKNISSLSQDGETTGLAKDEYNDKSTEIMAKITSPSKFTQSGKKATNRSLTPVDSADAALVASTFNSSPKDIAREISKDKKDTDTLYKLVSPLVNRLTEKLSSPMRHKDSLFGSLKLHNEDNIAIISRQECNSVETVPSSNNLTAKDENRTPPSAPLVDCLINTSAVKVVDERESNGFDLQNTFSTSMNFPEGPIKKLQSGGPGKNAQTAVERTQSGEHFVEEQMKASVYASPDAHARKNERSPQKSPFRKKQTQSPTSKDPSLSPCRKEMHNALHGDNMKLSVAKDVVSLNCSPNVHRIDDCLRRSNPSPVQDIQNISKRKRTSEEVACVDVLHSDNIQMQHGLKFCKVGEKNMDHTSEYSYGSSIENERIEGVKILMNQTDINMLEDKLLHQQKVNILELLCSEIQSQLCSAYNESCNILHKRVAETRQLLYRIVYGKAKMQLMHVKRERLLVELLRTGVRESQLLKLNYAKHHSVSAEKDTKLGDNSCSVIFLDNLEGAGGKVSIMKREVEALEKKIKNLTKSFHIYCKIKGEQSSSGTIELVNDHLKKRTCCRFIRQDIQMWEVDDLQNRNGHHNIVLNYHGFISQSLTLNTGRGSSIFVANKLNDMNISKNFPNMDACFAFRFVFNHEPTKKYVGPKSLAQETQLSFLTLLVELEIFLVHFRTCSLLRNLLDVVEEVQIAQLEIRNMTLNSFNSPSAKQLDLQFAFIDFDSGVKVTMTLDMTCLNCGVYPSDILPYQLQTSATGTENLTLSAEIKAAVGNLRSGYSRIIRICRCVSQVIQSSGR
ncbi:Cytochrome P450 [Gossypium australe]|uniref:Cytochrome P450 n=1 Tax=Gossypium australe TaxID=47621 RepID=A0A5B6VYN8_9ROSI|nr:Cytochrome P450 [Gossypium australe]